MSLSVKDLSFAYEQSVPVLKHISFGIEDGQIVALLGGNGIGKSTLIKNILNLLHPQHGSCYVGEQRISSLSRREMARLIAYVPQSMRSVFSMTVFDFVRLGASVGSSRSAKLSLDDLTESILRQFDLTHLAFKDLTRMSGGERQRVYLARGMAQRPKVLLLDEPTASLDLHYQKMIFEQLKYGVEQMGMSVLIAIHDLNLAARYCDRFLLLQDGSLHASGTLETVFQEDLLSAAYKVPLIITHIKEQPLVSLR